MTQQTASSTLPAAKAGKYLTFRLGPETYGLEILQVREIIGFMAVTPVPRMPDFIRGVINLRGRVIPVTDLRLRFGMEASQATASSCIIVVRAGELEMGLVVDQVVEVLDMPAGQIEEAPSFGQSVDVKFVSGIGMVGGHVTLLLDLNTVLSSDAVAQLQTS
ncbi:MAG: chemotaxis protein CheW [Planctomycetaceae bacterium]|nr:chemotaxis protein CheW [Planctomycetaceae bacterium]